MTKITRRAPPQLKAAATAKDRLWSPRERFAKKYRHPVLDSKLTKQRCRAEARTWRSAVSKTSGKKKNKNNNNSIGIHFNVPRILRVELPILYLEYLDADQGYITMKRQLQEILLFLPPPPSLSNGSSDNGHKDQPQPQPQQVLLQSYARSLGIMISQLHYDLGIVHGDLTTSNMMVINRSTPAMMKSTTEAAATSSPPPESSNDDLNVDITLIDFGLSKNTESAEERAVDLYVLERASLIDTSLAADASIFGMT